jgi:site-specific DNA-methyltransferase (adenine-specific)
VLERGREAYRTADAARLALLSGLDCVPVHRNAGFDALLKREVDGGPAPIRVQRPGESVAEAAAKLHRAGASKGARRMFLIVQDPGPGPAGGEALPLPEGVVAIDSPAAAIRRRIDGGRPS